MSDLISRLRGDGYLLLNIHERQTLDYEAADELDRLNAQALELCAEISGLRRENERLRSNVASMRHDLAVLRGFHHEGCMAEIERLRGLLRESVQYVGGLAYDDELADRIDAALAGATDQPNDATEVKP